MIRALALFFVVCFAFASSVRALAVPPVSREHSATSSAAPPEGTMRSNLSAEFAALMESASTQKSLFRELQNFKILIVPGFKNAAMARSSGDFADQISVLKDGGLIEKVDFQLLSAADNFGGLREMASNAAAIAQAISSSNRPVILVSQSKGSVDVLEALSNHVELQGHVHAWFSIQGALWGSQIADGIEAKPKDRFYFHHAMQLLGGSPTTIIELQKTIRTKYMRDHAATIRQLCQRIHVISWASYKAPSEIWWPLQKLDGGYFKNVSLFQSDGVVQLPDALLPQSDYIIVNNVDHADSTLQVVDKNRKKTESSGFDRRRFMIAIAALTLH